MEEEEEELPVDYAFLDEDEEIDYNDINSVNFRLKRRKRESSTTNCDYCVKTGIHIVYKRKDVCESHHSDYSKLNNTAETYIGYHLQTNLHEASSMGSRKEPMALGGKKE